MSNTNSQNVINFVKRRKKDLISVFHSKCCICGFNAFQEALEFHHVNPSEKEFGLTTSTSTRALSKQLVEMKKCILVCANCHRGIHANKIQVPQNYKDFYDDKVAQNLLDKLDKANHGQVFYCKKCGKEITKGATYCEECAKVAFRKVERPSREKLKQLIRTTSFLSIGKLYGVSDNAIRKWCDFYNLPRKVSEIKSYTDKEWEEI